MRPKSATVRAGNGAGPAAAASRPIEGSPGKALRAARARLQSELERDVASPLKPAAARALDVDAAAGAAPAAAPAYDDTAQEIADIDSRLHALQNFLKQAKSGQE